MWKRFIVWLFASTVLYGPAVADDTNWTDCASDEAVVAIAGCTRVIAAAPNETSSANAYYNRGVIEWLTHKSDAAFSDFSRAIDLVPKHDFALHNRALIYVERGDYAAAIAGYTAAITANPIGGHYFNRGRAYFQAGQYRDAADDFTVTITLWPEGPLSAYPWAARCRALAARNVTLEDARSDCEKAVSANGIDPQILTVRAFVRFRQNDFEGVVSDASAALALPMRKPHDDMPLLDVGMADAYFLRGLSAGKLGQQDACERDLKKSAVEDPTLAARYAQMGVGR